MIAGLIAIVALVVGKREFCHYFCWIAPFMVLGKKIRNLGKWPSLRLIAKKEDCIDCMACSQNCPMSINVNSLIHSSTMEHAECILCGTCIDIFPKDIINYSFSSERKNQYYI